MPSLEFSLIVLNESRTKMLQRLPLLQPAPIYPIGHKLTIDDDEYVVVDVETSIVTSDDKLFTCYTTEVIVKGR